MISNEWVDGPDSPGMDPFGALLYPIKYLIEVVLTGAHTGLAALGLNADGGLIWVLSILALVALVRLALLPLALRLNTSQRLLATLRPQMLEINERYAGQLGDAKVRKQMLEETTALYKDAKANPLAPFLPVAVQVVIFIALFQVLSNALADRAGVGLLGLDLAQSFSHASLFGVVPLADSIFNNHANPLVALAGVLILATMTVAQVLTQRVTILANSVTGRMADTNRFERVLIFVVPFISVVSTFIFPLMILFYWGFSNLWTLGQQSIISRTRPMPGSYAERQLAAKHGA